MSAPTIDYTAIPIEEGHEEPVISSPHRDGRRPILFLFGLFWILILLLFTWPEYVARHYHGEPLGWTPAVELAVELFAAAVLISLVILVLAIRQWHHLSQGMQLVAITPIFFLLLLLGISIVMGNTRHIPDPCPPGGEPCPRRKHGTGPEAE